MDMKESEGKRKHFAETEDGILTNQIFVVQQQIFLLR